MRKEILYPLVLSLSAYVVFEIVVSVLYLHDVIEPPASFWVYENSHKTIVFDPIRGYRLLPEPSRFARITKGTVEYVGVLRGNNEGFPDRDDFSPERTEAAPRIAVFGDSFTAAQFLDRNWPDAVEDIARGRGHPLQLLNFSIHGGGLANWWSVIIHLVKAQDYALDGIVFAVFPGDLLRKFTVSDDRGRRFNSYDRIDTWDPAAIPKSPEEARRYLVSSQGHIVPPETFEKAIRGHWTPPSSKELKPYFASKLLSRLAAEEPAGREQFEPGALELVEDIRDYVEEHNLRVMVVHIPSREQLVNSVTDIPALTRQFAELLDAHLLDGAEAFKGKTADEIRAMWLPYDGHWADSGSDHFAAYLTPILNRWIETP